MTSKPKFCTDRLYWQPIATAPKDQAVLTYRGAGLMAVAECIPHPRKWPNQIEWIWCCTDGMELLNVTHWMPLPYPPSDPARLTKPEESQACGSAGKGLPAASPLPGDGSQ